MNQIIEKSNIKKNGAQTNQPCWVYKNPWFGVVKEGQFHYVKEHNANNGAAVLLTHQSQILLIYTSRSPFDNMQWEIPRGYSKNNESAEQTAIRETAEETGYIIREEDLTVIGKIKPNSSLMQSEIKLFHAEIKNKIDRDEIDIDQDEGIVQAMFFDSKDVFEAVASGDITDSFTLSALACYLLIKNRDHNKHE